MRAFTHSCVAAATKTCAVLSALALLLASVPAAAYASVVQSVGEDEVCVSDLVLDDDPLAELPDADELAEGYIESVFYADDEDALKAQSNYGLIYLEDDTQLALYAALKSFVADVAANGGSTKFTYTFDTPYNAGYSTSSENMSALDLSSIIACLRDDCPYEMYWYDRYSSGSSYGYSSNYSTGSITQVRYTFKPGTDYVGDEDYTVDESKAQATATAAANAKAIVEEHADEASVLDMLLAYRDEICDLTSYNYDAAESSDTSEVGINPWQLVWVFDGDEDTTVVCEGYARAFQYLCDLTWPDNDPVTCYTVIGYLGSGGHAWNIVRVDDLSYLVDVTNSDYGTVGYSGGLFLAHDSLGTGSVSSGYTMIVDTSNSVEYTYKEATISLYGETILTLSTTAFPGLSSSSADDGEGDWNVVTSTFSSYRWRVTATDSVLQIAPREGNSTGTISGINTLKFTVAVTTTSTSTMYGLAYSISTTLMPWSDSASSITAVEVADGMSVAGAARGLFYNLSAATSISLPEGFVTSDVTNLSGMFAYCNKLTSLDVSGWDTSSVTSFNGMFVNCRRLTALDLSGWDTSAVTDFTGMFYYCYTLATISVCNCWSTQSVESSTGMFAYCWALEGGNGTSYSSSYTDATYACLDTDDATGYLTLGTLVTATVADEDGDEVTTGYSSLQDALDAVGTAEATITLACDVTEGATIASGSTVTLDLAGRSLTAATPALACAGTLSILDSGGDGVVTATADDDDAAAYAVSATDEGGVIITGGRFAGELATSDDATIAVSGGLFSEELASEHVAAGLARAHMSGGVADESYPYTVVEQCYAFLGGSLRMDYTTTDDDGNTVADYTQTSLRFGYTITAPDDADADSVSWSWTYGRADSDTWMGTVNGTYKTDLGDNSWRSNIVITGVPSTSYSETLRTRLTVVYTCSDGTTYTVTDADQTRSVAGVAAAILDSTDDGNDATKASESEVTYATGIAAVAGA